MYREEFKKVIGDILKSETPDTNCVICMEELAELQQEIIKLDRFERRNEKHE